MHYHYQENRKMRKFTLFRLIRSERKPGVELTSEESVQPGPDQLPERGLLARSCNSNVTLETVTSQHSPILLSIVLIAAWLAFRASSSTPSEQEERLLMVKPRGLKSGLRALRAVSRSCRDLPQSGNIK